MSRALADRLGAELFSEAYRRLEPIPSLDFRDAAGLLALERSLLDAEVARFQAAARRRSRARRIVLDTGPWGPLTYSWGLRELVDPKLDVIGTLVEQARRHAALGHWPLPELTVFLDVPEAVCDARAQRDPEGHPPALHARHRTVARFERLLYERQFPAALPGRFVEVAGDAPVPAVVASLADRLERIGPLPLATASEADRLLDLFPARAAPSTAATRPPKP